MRAAMTVLALLIAGSIALAGEPPKPAGETVVLDLGLGSYRVFLGWKTPTLISADGKLKPLREPRHGNMKEEDRKPMPMVESDRPPASPSSTGSGSIGWN